MKSRAALLAATVLVSLLAFPSDASAACTSQSLPERTIHVGGQQVVTQPAIFLEVCASVEGNPSLVAPSVRIEQNFLGQFAILVDQPAGGPVVDLDLTYRVGATGDSQSVTVPVSVLPPGTSTCLVFAGPDSEDPGDCLIEIRGG